jgi:hypothetical protein
MWGVDARGRVVAAWTDSSFVLVRGAGTDIRLRLPNYRESLSAENRAEVTKNLDQFEENAKRRGAKLEGPRPPVPASRPQIDALLPEMNGGVTITRSRACDDVPEWRAPGSHAPAAAGTERCAFVERFDAEGIRLRPFTLGPGDRLRAMRADTAWVIRENADGLQRVLKLVVPKA